MASRLWGASVYPWSSTRNDRGEFARSAWFGISRAETDDVKRQKANKRGAGKGGFAVLWRAGRAWPALPDRERYVHSPREP